MTFAVPIGDDPVDDETFAETRNVRDHVPVDTELAGRIVDDDVGPLAGGLELGTFISDAVRGHTLMDDNDILVAEKGLISISGVLHRKHDQDILV